MIILYGDLTREDSRMRVSLKGLPDKLRLEEKNQKY